MRTSWPTGAVVFDVEAVVFPWYYFSGGLQLTLHGVCYRFGFARPANAALSDEGGDLLGSIARARRSGRAWRAVFAEQAGQGAAP